jgi:hypothetical protein
MKSKDGRAIIHVVLEEPLATALDDFRRRDEDLPTRQRAIRKILERVLIGKGKAKAAA